MEDLNPHLLTTKNYNKRFQILPILFHVFLSPLSFTLVLFCSSPKHLLFFTEEVHLPVVTDAGIKDSGEESTSLYSIQKLRRTWQLS
jgi:hypothetical protein